MLVLVVVCFELLVKLVVEVVVVGAVVIDASVWYNRPSVTMRAVSSYKGK